MVYVISRGNKLTILQLKNKIGKHVEFLNLGPQKSFIEGCKLRGRYKLRDLQLQKAIIFSGNSFSFEDHTNVRLKTMRYAMERFTLSTGLI